MGTLEDQDGESGGGGIDNDNDDTTIDTSNSKLNTYSMKNRQYYFHDSIYTKRIWEKFVAFRRFIIPIFMIFFGVISMIAGVSTVFYDESKR